MKSKFLFSLALLWAVQTFAQFEKPRDITYEISDPYRVVDATSKLYFNRGTDVLSIKITKKNFIVQSFNADAMKAGFKKELELPKGADLETVTELGDKILIFYSIWDRGREAEQLYYREVNFSNGAWKGPQKQIISTRGKVAGTLVGSTFSYKVVDKFDFHYSADNTKMMVQYRKAPKNKNDARSYDEIGLFVYDANMKEIWGEEVRMPYTEKKMNNIDYSVDVDGNAYILAEVYDDDSTRKKKKGTKDPESNYHLEMLKKEPGVRELNISKLELNGKFITSVSIFETVDDLMVLAGFYNNSAASTNADGVFYAKLDKDGGLYDEQSFAIPVEIINQYESKRAKKKNDKKEEKGEAEFASLRLRKIQFLSDGSIILIGEQYYVLSHTSTNSKGVSTTYYTYHYNDILVSKIDPAGDLAWMRKMPKNQYGRSGKGSMGFMHTYEDGYHYFMYMDVPENLELPFDEAPRTYSDGRLAQLTAYIVDDDRGEVTKEAILDMENAKGMKLYQFSISRLIKLSDSEFLFEAYKKKKEDVMVKISIKE
jgi:hypothetical protein